MEITVKKLKGLLEKFNDDAIISVQADVELDYETISLELEEFYSLSIATSKQGKQYLLLMSDGNKHWHEDERNNAVKID